MVARAIMVVGGLGNRTNCAEYHGMDVKHKVFHSEHHIETKATGELDLRESKKVLRIFLTILAIQLAMECCSTYATWSAT
jgi:hypothetical protein